MSGKRVTIYDIAEELKISTATVNRALTGKNKVSEETRKRVFEAAERMGFRANTLARSLARRPIRLAVLAFTSFPEFHTPLIQGAQESQRELVDYNIQVDYFSFSQGDSNTVQGEAFLDDTLERVMSTGYDGLLACARSAEKFQMLREKGIPVVTVVNDIEAENRRFCIRYNGFVAGRMAAELLWRMGDRSRPVVIASGSYGASGIHREILEGFRTQMHVTPLKLAGVLHHHDNSVEAYEATKTMLRTHPDVGGIYVDSFNSKGVLDAIYERKISGDITIITSDIYDRLRDEIRKGTVVASIFQNQYEQGRQGLRYLYQSIADGLQMEDTLLLPPQLIMQSNLELY